MKLITFIVPTYNEEIHLGRCLESMAAVQGDIFVVDSKSTDFTRRIAEQHGATVIEGEWKVFSEKLNWALENLPISTPWVMRVDADEYLTPELANELSAQLPLVDDGVSAFEVKRRIKFLGRWIRYGGVYPSWQVRLWRHGKAKFEARDLDEHMLVAGRIDKLGHDFVDENIRGIHDWVQKHNVYSDRELSEHFKLSSSTWRDLKGQAKIKRFLKDEIYGRFPLFLRPMLYWVWRYFFRMGFLDGTTGFIYHFLQGFWYRFLVDVKVLERTAKQ